MTKLEGQLTRDRFKVGNGKVWGGEKRGSDKWILY